MFLLTFNPPAPGKSRESFAGIDGCRPAGNRKDFLTQRARFVYANVSGCRRSHRRTCDRGAESPRRRRTRSRLRDLSLKCFRLPLLPSANLPQAPKASTPPVPPKPAQSGPGEFTRFFSAASIAVSAPAPVPQKTGLSGEFAHIFGSGNRVRRHPASVTGIFGQPPSAAAPKQSQATPVRLRPPRLCTSRPGTSPGFLAILPRKFRPLDPVRHRLRQAPRRCRRRSRRIHPHVWCSVFSAGTTGRAGPGSDRSSGSAGSCKTDLEDDFGAHRRNSDSAGRDRGDRDDREVMALRA